VTAVFNNIISNNFVSKHNICRTLQLIKYYSTPKLLKAKLVKHILYNIIITTPKVLDRKNRTYVKRILPTYVICLSKSLKYNGVPKEYKAFGNENTKLSVKYSVTTVFSTQ